MCSDPAPAGAAHRGAQASGCYLCAQTGSVLGCVTMVAYLPARVVALRLDLSPGSGKTTGTAYLKADASTRRLWIQRYGILLASVVITSKTNVDLSPHLDP